MRRALRAAALLLGWLCMLPAQAGRNCEARPPSPQTVQRALDLAVRTAAALDATGADVVVLGRAGQDLRKYHLRWSHLGLAYRDADGHWRVVHKLNQCATAQAQIYRQGLGDFFLDDLFDYQAAYEVPTAAVQARLRPLLADDARVVRLDTPAYSMVAYAWAQRYQQSNQWAIETLALAQDDAVDSRAAAQAWLRRSGYQPTELHLSPLVRLGARLTAANIAFDDHPNALRFSDRIQTVTVDSVFDWLPRAGLAGPVQVLR